jgi:hypothetical protein
MTNARLQRNNSKRFGVFMISIIYQNRLSDIIISMLQINFHPEADIPRFIEAAEEYKKIWGEDGEKIKETIEKISGFKFKADIYNAIILDNKPSASYPLTRTKEKHPHP